MTDKLPLAIVAAEAPPRALSSTYPAQFAALMEGRVKRPLGKIFGLTNFGVNLTRLAPGAVSALRHAHTRQDEFVYILEGEATLLTDRGEARLVPGMCAGFRAGTGDGHHLVNRTDGDVVYLEVGDRSSDDEVSYPDDDIVAKLGTNGRFHYTRKDGTEFDKSAE